MKYTTIIWVIACLMAMECTPKITPQAEDEWLGYDKAETQEGLHASLFQNYACYHIQELNFRRIKRRDIAPFIDSLRDNAGLEVTKLGESVEGRDINMIKLGRGAKKVMLWSQMHGDESTATRALFEILRFFTTDDTLNAHKQKILDETTLYIIPMLNPDGAEVFQRRNALSIDVNRDALKLISPESRILKEARDKHQPEFGFNLHDQSKYYNVSGTGKTASISFLAPAYNFEKDVNEGRANAMKLIASMNRVLQQYIPGCVGRYDDTFEPRAFGDNFQKWGTNTILIESGGYRGDPEKRRLVKMNFIVILHALEQIASNGYRTETLDAYYRIPENDRNLFDLLIRNATVMKEGESYRMDIGVFNYYRAAEDGSDICHRSIIGDWGDLSTYYGYQELDAEGLIVSPGQVYPEVLKNSEILTADKAYEWLRQGYSSVRMEELPPAAVRAQLPMHIVPAEVKELPAVDLGADIPLMLGNGSEFLYAVINGKLLPLNSTNRNH